MRSIDDKISTDLRVTVFGDLYCIQLSPDTFQWRSGGGSFLNVVINRRVL
jgi:hypothetical protein